MKKLAFLRSFTLVGFLLLNSIPSTFGAIQEESPPNQSQEVITHIDSSQTSAKSHTLEFGLQAQYLDYKENVPGRPDFKSEERGVVPGLSAGYSYLSRLNPVFFNGVWSYSSSDIHYDGALQNGTPLKSTSGLSVFQVQLTSGYFLIRNSDTDFSTYAGINIRNWNRLLDKASLSQGGSYSELYTSIWLPIGLKWNYFFSDRFQLGVDASLGIPLISTFRIVFPGSMFQQSDDVTLANTLKTGISWKIQVPATYWVSSTFGMTLNPFVESFSYENSFIGTIYDPTSSMRINEPASRTYQVGSQLKAALKF